MRPEKANIVSDLSEELKESSFVLVADYQPENVLRAQLLGLLMSPATKLVRVLNEPASAFARLLNAKASKGEPAAAKAESPARVEVEATSAPPEPAATEPTESKEAASEPETKKEEPPATEVTG